VPGAASGPTASAVNRAARFTPARGTRVAAKPRRPGRGPSPSSAPLPMVPVEPTRSEQPRRWNGRALDLESPYVPATSAPAQPARTQHTIDRTNPFPVGGKQ